MWAYRVQRGAGIGGLERFQSDAGRLTAHQVRVRMHAVALNYRDLLVANRRGTADQVVVPASDGAGEVVAAGTGVTSVAVGDRVMPTFFPDWQDGEPTIENTARALGGSAPGVLAHDIVAPETALVRVPTHLGFVEAATLPCAGVTAWHALFELGKLAPLQTVLLLGTGGVSIWALQLAKAAGLRVIITSSDEGKLQRARALGADHIVNYIDTPDWAPAVRRANAGRGVDLVIETGGHRTLAQSIAAARMGGRIAIVGGTSGFDLQLDAFDLIDGRKQLSGVLVGSRAMHERLAGFVAQHRVRPVVDRTFAFDEAREALAYVESARHFGKVVIDFAARAAGHASRHSGDRPFAAIP